MLDVGRKSSTPGGISDRPGSDYAFLVAHLSRRYDPPEREEAHRAELRARTRRRNESADEYAENLKNLAQRAYTSADQNMLDNLVVERFREGNDGVLGLFCAHCFMVFKIQVY